MPKSASGRKGRLTGLLFSSVFALAGVGLSIFGVFNVRRALASGDWPSVQGRVTSSSVERRVSTSHRDGRRRREVSYEAEIRYEYEVDGEPYHGSRRSFGGSSDSRFAAEEVVARYRAGTRPAVYYDPEDPAACVLEPGASLGAFIPSVIGAVFTPFGGVIFVAAVRGKS